MAGRTARQVCVGALASVAAAVTLAGCAAGPHRGSALPTPAAPSSTARAAVSTVTSSGALPTSTSATRATATASATRASVARISAAPADARLGGSALSLLARIPVKGRAPQTGYDRARFGSDWTDDTDDPLGHNGCDTRNDILRRDLTNITLKPDSHGCTVSSGTLLDPYTGELIAFHRGTSTSARVQIDHVVALSDAWQTGAQYWTEQRRTDLANDPLELLAVDGPTNEAKGDGDAATWLPPNKAYRCAYVARQVAVKARYGLWMTAAEHAASARVLAACPGRRAPTESGAPDPLTSVHPPAQPTTTHAASTAPVPAAGAAPGGATARCNDGTYSYAAHHQGACSHHGGVAIFYH